MDLKQILIIDDDPALLKFLSVRLRNNGFQVRTAYDGRKGLTEVHEKRPDLIILDLHLPSMPGEEICKAIRENEDKELSKIPIIMLTGKTSDADRVIGKVIGANSYIPKPFKADELLNEIRRLT